MTILEKIIAQKEREVSGLERTLKNAKPLKNHRSFLQALKRNKGEAVKLIAEIKKASPSKGAIAPEADVVEIGLIYEENGAAAISVLTDYEFFQGSLSDLNNVVREVEIPVLRKDFIIDKGQILEARLSEASAVLLMTSVLKTTEKLKEFREYAESLGMDALVETQDEAEIQIALASGAKIMGVNARHFSDLSVDIKRVPPLLQLIPNNIIKVAESGISTKADVDLVSPYCDAVLIGSSFMSGDPRTIKAKIDALLCI
ncbi:indole-3-glycerol-phosphate synthase [bacterium]|nr:indole-3-glycerol-phosphate synthase [bacterium]NCQ54811.1 indole-3-glycerol-phosphate synthase [Candidatus Parcubacteria bacterium]NCS66855.1 indole-3-glycerol-phosphate synthase [Candidatus Peregrinibacteria bacterium]NCS95801.1 indole-3-glycerol-phosphate synthase [bacterium]